MENMKFRHWAICVVLGVVVFFLPVWWAMQGEPKAGPVLLPLGCPTYCGIGDDILDGR